MFHIREYWSSAGLGTQSTYLCRHLLTSPVFFFSSVHYISDPHGASPKAACCRPAQECGGEAPAADGGAAGERPGVRKSVRIGRSGGRSRPFVSLWIV